MSFLGFGHDLAQAAKYRNARHPYPEKQVECRGQCRLGIQLSGFKPQNLGIHST